MQAVLTKPSLDEILTASAPAKAKVIGHSRQGNVILGYMLGNGPAGISLIGGCHADEPVGPAFLNHLVGYLNQLPVDHDLLTHFTWMLVPHTNPDGSAINDQWWDPKRLFANLALNLKYAVRELPGDDLEFGFPIEHSIKSLRPENQAIYEFWKEPKLEYILHASLHGMHLAYGPWFLYDRDFFYPELALVPRLQHTVKNMGYVLHDVDRKGEKGFYRLAEGFGSRPHSEAMRRHFLDQGDSETAAKFHASSMESMRSLCDSCLTIVTEMPLFIIADKPSILQWPDPNLLHWSEQINRWRLQLQANKVEPSEVNRQAHDMGLRPMSINDQMRLQWDFIWESLAHQFTQI